MLELVFYLIGQVHNVFASCKEGINLTHDVLAERVMVQVQEEETQLLTRLQHIASGRGVLCVQLCQGDRVHGRYGNMVWKWRDFFKKLFGRHIGIC